MRQPANHSTDNKRSTSLPIAVRLVFVVIGMLLLILSVKVASFLFQGTPEAKEVFQFCLLAIGTVMSLSFAAPEKQMVRIFTALSMVVSILIMSAALWRFGGYWRWGIVLLVATLPILIFKAIRNRHGLEDSSIDVDFPDLAGFDAGTSNYGGGCDGGGGGD